MSRYTTIFFEVSPPFDGSGDADKMTVSRITTQSSSPNENYWIIENLDPEYVGQKVYLPSADAAITMINSFINSHVVKFQPNEVYIYIGLVQTDDMKSYDKGLEEEILRLHKIESFTTNKDSYKNRVNSIIKTFL